VIAFHEIENLMPMKEPADKTRMFRTLLKDQLLEEEVGGRRLRGLRH
jgi:hypothetical protein